MDVTGLKISDMREMLDKKEISAAELTSEYIKRIKEYDSKIERNERDQERMSTVSLPPGAKALGSPLGDLALNAVGVRVVNLRRANGHQATAADDAVLQEGDTLVLSGHPTALALAEDKLLRG